MCLYPEAPLYTNHQPANFIGTTMLYIECSCERGTLWLVNGYSELEGRVEVYQDGNQFTVCHRISKGTANRICKRLGFSNKGNFYNQVNWQCWATLRLVHIIIIQTLGTRVVQCFQGLLIMVDIYSTDFSGRPREGSGMLFLFWAEL